MSVNELSSSPEASAYRVVVTDLLPPSLEWERQILGDLAELEACQAASEDDLSDSIAEADAVMVYHTIRITEKTIR
ncbi:MAG: hypothetical protein ACK5ZJ_05120, partial [Acidobacteriota bacterium]